MNKLLKLISNFKLGKLLKTSYTGKLVGNGHYALRENTSIAGIKYTKLVKADKSNVVKKA